MTIDQIQNDIVEEFSDVDDWMDRYAMIIDLGNSLPEIDEKYKTPDHLIEGCEPRVAQRRADARRKSPLHRRLRRYHRQGNHLAAHPGA